MSSSNQNTNIFYMETETLLPATREINLSTLNKVQGIGKDEFQGAIGQWEENDQANSGLNPFLIDEEHRVDMTFDVRWITKNQAVPFATLESYGERWEPIQSLQIGWTASGESWDERTLNLHPAVAGLATTDAGFDAAYLSALAATNQLMAQAQRVDISQTAREHIGRMLRQNIQPFRLLMRGASMWLSLAMTQDSPVRSTPIIAECVTSDARPMITPQNFNGHLLNHVLGPHDAVYVRLDDSNAHGILGALVAMTGSINPVPGAPEGLKAMWPPMHAPVVYYSADITTPAPRAPYTREEVWLALAKICETYDCWDLLQEAMSTVATMLLRPKRMATWMGRNRFAWNLPASDFKAGICGPLFNGVSAQGMKTHPIPEPNYKKVIIEGCLRSSFILSSAYVHLSNYAETHYALRGLTDVERPLLSNLASLKFTQRFNDACGSIASTLGWKRAMGRTLRGIRIGAGQALAQVFVDCMNYPSVLTLLPWTKSTSMDDLATAILRPAVPEAPKYLNGWMKIEHRGIVSDTQVAAALLRLPVRLRFKVEYPNGKVRHIEGPPSISPNRGMPLLSAKLQRTDVKISTHVMITKPLTFLEKLGFCSQLNNSHVVVEQRLTEEIDLSFWDQEDPGDQGDGRAPAYTGLMEPEESEWPTQEPVRPSEPQEKTVVHQPAQPMTPKEVGDLLQKYTGLGLANTMPPDLQSPDLWREPFGGIRAGTDVIYATISGQEPQEVLGNAPPNMRASLAGKITEYIGTAISIGRNTMVNQDLQRYRDRYAALAGALETDDALSPQELADREKLRQRGFRGVAKEVRAATTHLAEGNETEAARAMAAGLLGDGQSWAEVLENNDRPGFQPGPSGERASTPASGTHTQGPTVEGAGDISAPTSGTLGFSDPAGSSL